MGLRIPGALLARLTSEEVIDVQEGLLGYMPRQSPYLDSVDDRREAAIYAAELAAYEEEFARRDERHYCDPQFYPDDTDATFSEPDGAFIDPHYYITAFAWKPAEYAKRSCPHSVNYRWGDPCITCDWDAYDRRSAPDDWFDWNQYDDRRNWDARAERYFDSFYSDFLGDDENLRAWEELGLLNPTWPSDQLTAYRPAASKDLRARRFRATRLAEQRRLQSVLNGTNKGSIDELTTEALATIWQVRYPNERRKTPPHRVLRALSQDLRD